MMTDQESQAMTDAPKSKEDLEQQYVRLLELRIAQLQLELDKPVNKITTPKTHVANGDSSTTGTNQSEEGTFQSIDHVVESVPSIGQTIIETIASSDQPETLLTKDSLDDEADASTSKEGEKVKNASTARVKLIFSTFDDDIGMYIDKDQDIEEGVLDDLDDNKSIVADESAFGTTTFKRLIGAEAPKKVDREEIVIESHLLKRIYRDISVEPRLPDTEEAVKKTPLVIHAPFIQFVWHWDEFVQACKPQPGDDEEHSAARQDLEIIMNILRKSKIAAYLKDRETLLPAGKLPYDWLWTLFRPGTKVYAKPFMEETQMLEVNDCDVPTNMDYKTENDKMEVHCSGFDWTGSTFEPVLYTFEIPKGKNRTEQSEVVIQNLIVYPTNFHKNDAETLKELKERGMSFWRTCDQQKNGFQFRYQGSYMSSGSERPGLRHSLSSREAEYDDTTSIYSAPGNIDFSDISRRNFTGPIIIDAQEFLYNATTMGSGPPLGYMPSSSVPDLGCTCRYCTNSPIYAWRRNFTAPVNSSSKQMQALFEDFKDDPMRLALCPPRVLGYILRERVWAQFKVSACKPGKDTDKKRKDSFRAQLQLPQIYKDLLLTYVQNHSYGRLDQAGEAPEDSNKGIPQSLDIIDGKGKGLAILLHGPPGVGKTLTAETIALATDRILLPISVAEIGSEATRAEENLLRHFAIAARWRAILLIDEADVFLEERVHTDNPNRNMLVSVLLRSLEYYEGIIFLTTNRIRSIDVAVQSRMQFTIQYKRLTPGQKHEIYKNFLEEVSEDKIEGDRASLYSQVRNQLCRRNDLNGRQIRNVVSMALALAKERGKNGEVARLRFDDLRRVHETTVDSLHNLKDIAAAASKRNEAEEDEDDRD